MQRRQCAQCVVVCMALLTQIDPKQTNSSEIWNWFLIQRFAKRCSKCMLVCWHDQHSQNGSYCCVRFAFLPHSRPNICSNINNANLSEKKVSRLHFWYRISSEWKRISTNPYASLSFGVRTGPKWKISCFGEILCSIIDEMRWNENKIKYSFRMSCDCDSDREYSASHRQVDDEDYDDDDKIHVENSFFFYLISIIIADIKALLMRHSESTAHPIQNSQFMVDESISTGIQLLSRIVSLSLKDPFRWTCTFDWWQSTSSIDHIVVTVSRSHLKILRLFLLSRLFVQQSDNPWHSCRRANVRRWDWYSSVKPIRILQSPLHQLSSMWQPKPKE